MAEIVNGIISGSTAGLVVAGLLGLATLAAKIWKRRSQIRHIRAIVTSYKRSIYSKKEGNLTQGPTPDQFRYIIFGGMRRDLESALDAGSSEITFNEQEEIKGVLFQDDVVKLAGPNHLPKGMKFYDTVFRDFEKIKCLKLS